MRRWTNIKRLIALQVFNGISAVGGGLALILISNWFPAAWFAHTSFPGSYFPGVILFAVVGGSALIAAASLSKRLVGSSLASLVAGMIMVFWIIGEIASIRGLHWLQAIYLATGLAVIYLTPSEKSHP